MTFLVTPIIDTNADGSVYLTKCSDFLDDYYYLLKEQGLLEYAFYDGSAKTEKEFAKTVISSQFLFLFIFEDPDRFPIGHIGFTNMSGYCGMGHFSLLRDYHKDSVHIGKECIRTVFDVDRDDGTPFLLNILGVIPIGNRAAVRFFPKIGFKPLCTLDKACYMYYKNKYEDGLLTRVVKNGT